MPSEAPQPFSIALINEAMQVEEFGAGLILPFLLRELSKRPQMLGTMEGRSLSTIGYLELLWIELQEMFTPSSSKCKVFLALPK